MISFLQCIIFEPISYSEFILIRLLSSGHFCLRFASERQIFMCSVFDLWKMGIMALISICLFVLLSWTNVWVKKTETNCSSDILLRFVSVFFT